MKYYLTVVFCLLCISSYVVAEETKYVTDSFSITMRTGKGTSHKIIKSIKTGTKLQVMEEDPEGYSRVILENGMEGWVLTRYLINEPIARTQLAKANQDIARLKKQTSDLKQELREVTKNHSSLSKSSTGLEKQNDKLKKELDHITRISANQLAINNENKELKQKLLSIKREMQTVQQENITLKDRSGREWFVRGAGVVIVGIILGLVLPRIRFQRKQRWNSL